MNFIYILLILLYLGIGQLYHIGSIDKAITQWVYLNSLNLISLIVFFLSKRQKKITALFVKIEIIIFFLFLVSLSISIFYSDNKTESVLKLSRWITIFVTTISLANLLTLLKPNFKLISILISISLLADLYFTLDAYFQFIKYSPYRFEFANYLKGVTGNKNITSASYIIRAPFIFYLMYVSKSNFLKVFLSLISITVIYSIFLLSARATFISLILIFVLGVIFELSKREKFTINSFLYFFVFVTPFIISLFSVESNSSAFITNRITTINVEDQSTSERLRFYEHAVNSILENPLTGIGLGNWKLKSIDFDKDNINSYVVPYHVHNDFLEIAVESGVIAVLLYITILFVVAKKFFVRMFYEKENGKKYFGLVIIMSGIGFVIDSMLNFPHARPIIMVMFSLLLASSITLNERNYER